MEQSAHNQKVFIQGLMTISWTDLWLCILSDPGLVEHLKSIPSKWLSIIMCITYQLKTVSIVYIVWDRYLADSLKQSTR